MNHTRTPLSFCRLLGLCVALSATLFACGPSGNDKDDKDPGGLVDDIENSVIEDSAGSFGTESDAETLTTQLLGGNGANLNLANNTELSMQGLGDGAKTLFVPSGCLTTEHTVADKTVSYTFKNCFGGQGLGLLNGVVRVTYNNPAPNRLVLTIAADDFHIKRSVFDFNASSDTTANGPARTVKWSANLIGKMGNGKVFERSNQKTLGFAIGQQCLSVDGSSTGKVNDKAVRFEIANFRRCRGQCPEPGGSFKVIDEAKGKSATLTFGAGTAEYTTSGGKKGSFPLVCAQND